MPVLPYDNREQIQMARWLARGLSLLLIGFVLLLLVLNEDVRSSPTLPGVILGILSFSMLIAWRWEKAGGMLILLLSAFLFLSFFIHWFGAGGLPMPLWQMVLIGSAMTLPYLISGWLFLRLGQTEKSAKELSA